MRLSGQHAAAAEGLRQLELAALPTGKEWKTWWNEWQHHMEMKFGWERAIVDAVTRLIRNQLTLARMIRNAGAGRMVVKYDSDGHVYGEETRWPDAITREALAWFINVISPTKRDALAWASAAAAGDGAPRRRSPTRATGCGTAGCRRDSSGSRTIRRRSRV